MTLLTFGILIVFGLILQKAFKTIRPIFRERAKINAEVTGRLTESLGGVRVVKGYHAEDSEARVFAAGVKRLLENVISSHHRAVAHVALPPRRSSESSARSSCTSAPTRSSRASSRRRRLRGIYTCCWPS